MTVKEESGESEWDEAEDLGDERGKRGGRDELGVALGGDYGGVRFDDAGLVVPEEVCGDEFRGDGKESDEDAGAEETRGCPDEDGGDEEVGEADSENLDAVVAESGAGEVGAGKV
jgi:hypothetical protein